MSIFNRKNKNENDLKKIIDTVNDINETLRKYNQDKNFTADKTLDKLVQEVGERIGGFRNKEKEIAYSLIASKLGSEPPTYLTVISAVIAVAMSSMSMAISFSNKNDVGIVAIAALIMTILFAVIIVLVFMFSIKGSRDMYVNHAVYEILSKRLQNGSGTLS